MILYVILLSPVVGYLLYRWGGQWLRARKRKQRAVLMSAPFPQAWRQVLADDFPLYRKLPVDLQRKLEGHINVFLQEKVFVGCSGFSITDEVRVLIAAQACLLILNTGVEYFPGFETILVYPQTYVANVTERDGALHSESVSARAGESWHRGPVIVAWDQVIQGARDGRDGHNVVMHEFAHKLDEENNRMDGLPILADRSQYQDWATVLSREYERLCQHHDDVIDSYGATSAAEFFAVVTEAFFEKPVQLKHKHPELYQQFQRYYRLDPVLWE
ncbi:zinc-dependent peptidase [Aestuariicella hydrocarbonica]|uniref:Zinc-dependent peptidase n=1 Tax=Pseudomaricurvus hydrocarbonicus TaxID=1470433 RepID=A0A9E5MNG9_9GAMM|nr:M90 family metallopeptidase [Aestuariicella hydrocarbonica]NHO67491.1 zinc-dependent peptidase [Aestuariicella hydrocarbonica]